MNEYVFECEKCGIKIYSDVFICEICGCELCEECINMNCENEVR